MRANILLSTDDNYAIPTGYLMTSSVRKVRISETIGLFQCRLVANQPKVLA